MPSGKCWPYGTRWLLLFRTGSKGDPIHCRATWLPASCDAGSTPGFAMFCTCLTPSGNGLL